MKKILAIIAVVALSLVMFGVAAADHSWNGFHWASDTLAPTVKNKTTSSLYDVPAGIAEWSALGTPIQPVLTDAKRGNITVSEAGSRSWLGLARVFVEGGHITKGEVKLNTNLLVGYGAAAADHVLCQELGHVLGLNHVDGASCMNSALSTLGDFTSPNAHDAEQLVLAYDHEDVVVDDGGPGNGKGNGRGKNRPQGEWVVVHVTPIP